MSYLESQLPVMGILSELTELLSSNQTVILQAPPGSGKTTRVPLALLAAPWLQNQKIMMLEPRRLAATNAARYMAGLQDEPVGASVGYTIRYARKTGPGTLVEVITEGLLCRLLQNDPELTGIGLVIFDEYHERSLQADLALALCHDIQRSLRQDLRILIMSATLDSEPLSRLLANCPIVTTTGRSFSTEIHYLPELESQRVAESTAAGIRLALKNTQGDILAFLPGAGDIHHCQNLLKDLSDEIAVRPLYGGLPFAEQEAAILPGTTRRVVLSTNVAETSLTIEGIETVVDSGWERRPSFDAARGMSRLETMRISRASAVQRAGRAGRIGPGYCYRLWSEATQGSLLPFSPAEIRQADLAPMVFELAQWGVHDPTMLSWLDPPPEGHASAARSLLVLLGALDKNGSQTVLGRDMARYPTHPRLARLLAAAVSAGCPGLGSDLVALLEERDILTSGRRLAETSGASDLVERLESLHRDTSIRTRAARKAARYWRKRTKASSVEKADDPLLIGRLLAYAYPDRIGLRRKAGGDKYLLSNGQGVRLSSRSVVRDAEWLVAVEVVGRGGEGEIFLASALSREVIEELFGEKLEWSRESGWDESKKMVFAREVRRLGALIIQERPVPVTAHERIPALLEQICRLGLAILPWTDQTRQLCARAALLNRLFPEQGWQEWSETILLQERDQWLAAFLDGIKDLNGLKQLDLAAALKARLGWQKVKEIDRLAPEKIEVPSGSRIKIDYTIDEAPVIAVKLQEMFGLANTPRLAEGRVPALIHLLSPAGRPLAVTQDLKSFWDSVYPEVQKEMKGRYPKHPWPDDPWQAPATRKTRKHQKP